MIEYDNRAMADKPHALADKLGLRSYRCVTPYGWLKVAAKDAHAARHACLCLTDSVDELQVYNGTAYVPVTRTITGTPP